MSQAGACLEVSNPIGIPNDFVLVVGYDRIKLACHVVGRSDTRLGVAFHAVWCARRATGRKNSAATRGFGAKPRLAHNILIGNQFPNFPRRRKRCVIAATAAVFLRKFAPFLRFLSRPLLFAAKPRLTISQTGWARVGRGANQCHGGQACFGRGRRSEF